MSLERRGDMSWSVDRDLLQLQLQLPSPFQGEGPGVRFYVRVKCRRQAGPICSIGRTRMAALSSAAALGMP
jgi:hypothetical protein